MKWIKKLFSKTIVVSSYINYEEMPKYLYYYQGGICIYQFNYELTISNKNGHISVKLTDCVGDIRGISTLIQSVNYTIRWVSAKSIEEIEHLLANANLYFNRSVAENLVVEYKLGVINNW
jgi:hypothetical protein